MRFDIDDYPEHKKLAAADEEYRAIQAFLIEMPYVLCHWNQDLAEHVPVGERQLQDAIYDHFDIDRRELEEEKQRMLSAALRAADE